MSILYAFGDPAAEHARRRDDDFFAENPRATWRVRPLLEGESPLVSGMCELGTGWRGYAVVIHHARARDRRARAGIAVYPVMIRGTDREVVLKEGERWVRWFKKSDRTPPPAPGVAAVM